MSKEMIAFAAELERASEFILEHDDFLVVSHIFPDGDAASSTCAVGLILQHFNKKFTMINNHQIPDKFRYLNGSSNVISLNETQVNRKFRHIISVDCADLTRVGLVQSLFDEQYQLLNIDHHATNNRYGKVSLVNPVAAATAEVLYDLIEYMRVPMGQDLATCIYTGLLTDTGGFRYSNTSAKVLKSASHLLEYGVQAHYVAEKSLERMTYAQLTLLQKALATLQFSANRKIGWLYVTLDNIRETNASHEDLDGLVNYPRNVEGVDVGVLFKQIEPNRYKVSLRSNEHVNVSEIAASFGGGGHIRAAGCSLDGGLDEVISRVIAELEKALS